MNKIVVDANILCLLIAGNSAPSSIGRHKRLKAYDITDYNRILGIIEPFDTIVTCAHILTETSNLLSNTNDSEKYKLLDGLKETINIMEEVKPSSALACRHNAYHRLGLTDAVLLSMELSGAPLLTADLGLTLAAQKQGMEAINYNWYRDGA